MDISAVLSCEGSEAEKQQGSYLLESSVDCLSRAILHPEFKTSSQKFKWKFASMEVKPMCIIW